MRLTLAVGNSLTMLSRDIYEFDLIEVVKGEKLELCDWTANPKGDSLTPERFEDNKEIVFPS